MGSLNLNLFGSRGGFGVQDAVALWGLLENTGSICLESFLLEVLVLK